MFSGTAETGLSWLPFYHDMGLIGHVLTPMYNCGSNYFISPLSFLRNPLVWPRALSRYKAGITGGPNFSFALLTSKTTAALNEGQLTGQSFDFSNLRICFCGAEPLSPIVVQKFFVLYSSQHPEWKLNPDCFMPCYGLAEATLCVTYKREGTSPTFVTVDRSLLESENKVKIVPNATLTEQINTNRLKTIVGLGN